MNKIILNSLLDEWAKDTEVISSIRSIMAHKNVPILLSYPKTTVSVIIKRLRKGNYHIGMFPLLHKITGENPVPDQYRGMTIKMAEYWILWYDNIHETK